MRTLSALILSVSCLTLVQTKATAAVLSAGTLIPVRLTQNINGNINQVGETVYFQVMEDVSVGGELLVRQGTFVKGKVHDAVGRKSLGKGGQLTLVPKSLTTESGDVVRFAEDPLSAEGRKRTGATVAHTILWGPLGLFAKGRAAIIFLDAEFDIEVDRDVDLPPLAASSITHTASIPDGSIYSLAFKRYPKKINYRKGKIQDDFVLLVSSPDGEASAVNRDSITITQVLDHELPEPIKPSIVQYDSKKHEYYVSLPFKEMVKYLTPGTSGIAVEINVGAPTSYTTNLTTEWKLD